MSPPVTGDMPAAVYRRPGRIDVQRRPIPALGADDVLVEVSHCGVCGSDLHSVLDGWGIPDTIGGHEYTGTVAAVGSNVTAWKPGDPVVGGPDPTCGVCEPCLAGRYALCLDKPTPGTTEYQGAFATHIRVDARQLLPLPAEVSLRQAALAEPLAVALHGIGRSGIAPGQRALVFGAGPIGALTLAALRARGIDDVGVVEPQASRAALAAKLGATRVRSPDELDVPSIAQPARIQDDAYDVVFEASGKRAAMEAGLAQLKRTGTLVLVGAGIDPPTFDPNRILLNELIVTGSFASDRIDFEEALELLASGRVPTDELIHPVDVPLAGLLETMHRLVAGDIAGKALVDPQLQEEAP